MTNLTKDERNYRQRVSLVQRFWDSDDVVMYLPRYIGLPSNLRSIQKVVDDLGYDIEVVLYNHKPPVGYRIILMKAG